MILARRVVAVGCSIASIFFAIHLYMNGGEPAVSAALVVVAVVATALAF